MYDGKLDSWPSAKIKLKSLLYRTGLWDVTQDGVSVCSDSRAHANAEPPSSEQEGEYFYSLRDVDVNGPCSGKTILDIVKILSSSGHISPETIYIYHASTTRGDWEPWSPGLINKIAVDSALIEGMRRSSLSPTTPHVSSTASTVPMPSSASGTMRSLDFGSPGSATSARDREVGQQRPCTREADVTALTKWLSINDFAKHRAKLTNRGRAQAKAMGIK